MAAAAPTHEIHDLVAGVESLRVLVDEVRQLRAELKELRQEASRLRGAAPASRTIHVETAAQMLGCSSRQVFRLLKQGRLKRAPKVGRAVMVTLVSVEELQMPEEGISVPRAEHLPTKVVPMSKAKRSAADIAAGIRKVRV